MTERVKTTHPKMKQANGLWWTCGADGLCSPDDIALRVFKEDRNVPSEDKRGNQMLYLFRRFGYPIRGWDAYKDLVSYTLTTPDPDIVLWCHPASYMWISFGYGKSEAFEKEVRQTELEMWKSGNYDNSPIAKRIEVALNAAMRELLRPVYIRDVDYNILGRVSDGEHYIRMKAAEPSEQAGYGLGKFNPVPIDK